MNTITDRTGDDTPDLLRKMANACESDKRPTVFVQLDGTRPAGLGLDYCTGSVTLIARTKNAMSQPPKELLQAIQEWIDRQ